MAPASPTTANIRLFRPRAGPHIFATRRGTRPTLAERALGDAALRYHVCFGAQARIFALAPTPYHDPEPPQRPRGHLTIRVFNTQFWCIGAIHWVSPADSDLFVHHPGAVTRMIARESSVPPWDRHFKHWFRISDHIPVQFRTGN